ncbi:unnamed protein product, partial [Didymodactylos carnosus]
HSDEVTTNEREGAIGSVSLAESEQEAFNIEEDPIITTTSNNHGYSCVNPTVCSFTSPGQERAINSNNQWEEMAFLDDAQEADNLPDINDPDESNPSSALTDRMSSKLNFFLPSGSAFGPCNYEGIDQKIFSLWEDLISVCAKAMNINNENKIILEIQNQIHALLKKLCEVVQREMSEKKNAPVNQKYQTKENISRSSIIHGSFTSSSVSNVEFLNCENSNNYNNNNNNSNNNNNHNNNHNLTRLTAYGIENDRNVFVEDENEKL